MQALFHPAALLGLAVLMTGCAGAPAPRPFAARPVPGPAAVPVPGPAAVPPTPEQRQAAVRELEEVRLQGEAECMGHLPRAPKLCLSPSPDWLFIAAHLGEQTATFLSLASIARSGGRARFWIVVNDAATDGGISTRVLGEVNCGAQTFRVLASTRHGGYFAEQPQQAGSLAPVAARRINQGTIGDTLRRIACGVPAAPGSAPGRGGRILRS